MRGTCGSAYAQIGDAMTKLVLVALLLSACIPRQQTHYIHQHQTLLYGSDAAIYAGCVRGVIRWHKQRTGQYPDLAMVQSLCVGVQDSFRDHYGDGGNT